MRIKICGIQNETEMAAAIRCGADVLGFQVGQIYQSKSFILPSTAGRLAAELPPYVTPVIVTHLSEPEAIVDILNKSAIFTVQLHKVTPVQVAALRDLLPANAKIILTFYLNPGRYDWTLDEYLSLIDAVNLDAFNLDLSRVGLDTADKVYQWERAAEFVAQCPRPVMLSGGLNAANVAQAIETVHPFGVDACNQLKAPDQFCDPAVCHQFVQAARLAGMALNPPPEIPDGKVSNLI